MDLGDTGAAKARFEHALTLYPEAEQKGADYAELLDVGARIATAEGNAAHAETLLRRAIDLVRDDAEYAEKSKAWQQRLDTSRPHTVHGAR
jgi:tetratricopeptide (TPR) repeat protein